MERAMGRSPTPLPHLTLLVVGCVIICLISISSDRFISMRIMVHKCMYVSGIVLGSRDAVGE